MSNWYIHSEERNILEKFRVKSYRLVVMNYFFLKESSEKHTNECYITKCFWDKPITGEAQVSEKVTEFVSTKGIIIRNAPWRNNTFQNFIGEHFGKYNKQWKNYRYLMLPNANVFSKYKKTYVHEVFICTPDFCFSYFFNSTFISITQLYFCQI